jgi:hypothetical protein
MWPEVLVRNDGEMGEIYGNYFFFEKSFVFVCPGFSPLGTDCSARNK